MFDVMARINKRIFYGVVALFFTGAVGCCLLGRAVNAASAPVVINEIMYNPLCGVDGDEFLEIYNTTSGDIDLTGWCFTAGITSCFSQGTTLLAHSYGLLSPDANRTQTTYGKTVIATYSGKLDNGGERVTLSDASQAVISSVSYDDVAPWPTTPDGTGPSLELKSPDLAIDNAASWDASTGVPTPGAVNSVFGAVLPVISNLSVPQNVGAEDSPFVSARVTDASSVLLVYKTMFNTEQTQQMFDDGNHQDGSAQDGVYGASVPAQAAGTLVRFKISAANQSGIKESPGDEDTVNYRGYVVKDDSIQTQLPILQWFMDPAQQADMIANHSHDDQVFPSVIAYDNVVIDNAEVHIKGITTRNLVKKAFAIDLPKGHKLKFANMTRAVDEFHLNSTYLDPSGIADVLAWRLAGEMGMPIAQIFKIRLQSNGDFYGLYTFAEEYDGSWRQEYNYETGSFYKDATKKTRKDIDDGTELQDWWADVSGNRTESRRQYILDNQDIPNMINTMAFQTFVRNGDWTVNRNQFSYHDITDTGRWSTMPYDLDAAWFGGSADVPGQHFMTPYEFPGTSDRFARSWRAPYLAIYDEPDLRKVFYRRLRTLADTYLTTDWYMQQYQQLKQQTAQEFTLDYHKWGSLADPVYTRENIAKALQETQFNMLNRFRKPWAVPERQSAFPLIDFDSVHPSFSQGESYIVLKNNSAETVDMTNWEIPELGFTFPLAAGLAPGQVAYLPRKDVDFRVGHGGSYVLGQLKQDIPMVGTLTLQRPDGTIADSEVY